MSLLVSDFVNDAQQELNYISGTLVSESDIILFLNRANSHFYTNFFMPTCAKVTDLLAYSGVPEYPLPSDFLWTMEPRKPWSLFSPAWSGATERSIYSHKNGNKIAVKMDRATPILVLNETSGSKSQIDACTSLTEGGTWAFTGDAASEIVDESIYSEGSSSLRFTITRSGGTSTLTKTYDTVIDLTDFVDSGKLFLDIKCPSTNTLALTSIRLRLGNSSTVYYEITATTNQNGLTMLPGWNQVGFDFQSKTETGSVDDTAIDYIQLLITEPASGCNGNYNLDNIFIALPVYYQLPYYSSHNVLNNSGTYQAAVTATTDTLACPPEFEEGFRYKALSLIAIQRLRDATLAEHFLNELKGTEKALKSRFPKQTMKVSFSTYQTANNF